MTNTIEADLRTLALMDTTFRDAVGTRIYPQALPLDVTLPAATLSYVDGAGQLSHGGPDGFLWARVQIDIYAATDLEAAQLRDALRRWLNGYSGYLGSTVFHLVELVLSLGNYEPAASRFRRLMDFMVRYTEV